MDRRSFLSHLAVAATGVGTLQFLGCRGNGQAHLLSDADEDMVGKRSAGAATWGPLVDQATGRLLARQFDDIQLAAMNGSPHMRKRVCFVGIDNRSAEEIGDFREQLYERIDTEINRSEMFEAINRRFVEAGLRETRLHPEDLFIPNNQRAFAGALERSGQPFEYLLFANITSGTTTHGNSKQRDYLLTMELVDMQTGQFDKESAKIRKAYHGSRLGKLKHFGRP